MERFTGACSLLRNYAVAAGMVLILIGCATPEDTAMMGGLLSGLAPYSKTPQGAASAAAMGQAASGFANAQAGRSQVIIQGGGPTSGSVGSPSQRADPAVTEAEIRARFEAALSQSSAPSSPPDKHGTLTLMSDTNDCEIFVDGAFIGNTPAKLQLAEGVHSVELKRTGCKPYKRDVTVSEGSELTLRPTLEKE